MFRKRDKKQKLKKQPKYEVENSVSVGAPRYVAQSTRRNRTRKQNEKKTFRYTPSRDQNPSLWAGRMRSFAFAMFPYRLVSLTLLCCCIGFLAMMGVRPEYYLNNIPVTGVQRITAAEIVAESGLSNRHIFSIDPVQAAQTIADNVGGILSAEVRLGWPQAVTINVEEDTPVAVFEYDGELQWANASGDLFPKRTSESGLIFIRSEQTTKPTHVPADVLGAALELNRLRSNLTSFTYQPGPGLIFTEEEGNWTVAVGTGNDMHQKLVMYNAIANELLTREMTIEYIDVSDLGKPYYRAFGLDVEAVSSQ